MTSYVEVSIVEDDQDVTGLQRAAELVAELLGPDREVKSGRWPGSWLVTLTDDETAELQANRYLGRSSETAELTAEWPS